jgi:hypothetical protein
MDFDEEKVMDKIKRFACLALLLVCSNNASASSILDTGTTSGDDAWALSSHQWLTDRLSIDADAILTEMGYYRGATSLHSDVIKMGARRLANWMIDKGMVDEEFYNQHPGRNMRHFERKWPGFAGHHPDNIDIRHHHRHIPAVPLPAAIWLFGSGLIGLIGFTRKKA